MSIEFESGGIKLVSYLIAGKLLERVIGYTGAKVMIFYDFAKFLVTFVFIAGSIKLSHRNSSA